MSTLARQEPNVWLVAAAFAAIYLIWGSTYLAIGIAVETMPPFLMGGTRFLISGLVLYPLVRRGQPRPTAANWRAAALIGCLLFVGGNGLVCWGQQKVPSGVAALLVATVPIWFALLDWIFYRGPRPGLLKIAGLLGGTAGVYVLLQPGRGGGPIHVASAAALLLACVFWATGSLHARGAALPKSPFLTAAMEMLIGGAAMLLIGSVTGEWARFEPAKISAQSLGAFLYLIVAGSMVSITAYVWLLQVSTPGRVSTYAYVNPVIAVLLGAWVRHEPITPNIIVGAAVIVAAVMLITLGGSKRREKPV